MLPFLVDMARLFELFVAAVQEPIHCLGDALQAEASQALRQTLPGPRIAADETVR